jgi:hypothetical protein
VTITLSAAPLRACPGGVHGQLPGGEGAQREVISKNAEGRIGSARSDEDFRASDSAHVLRPQTGEILLQIASPPLDIILTEPGIRPRLVPIIHLQADEDTDDDDHRLDQHAAQ